MRKAIMSLVMLAILMMSVSIVMAKGPYNPNAIEKNPNLHDFDDRWPTALDLKTSNGNFVQWYRDRHYNCQCTDGMNPDAIASKLNEGWFIWHPNPGDPRLEWCPEYIIKLN